MKTSIHPRIVSPGPMKHTGGAMHTDGIRKGGHGRGGKLANVKGVRKGKPLGRLPLQSPPAGVKGKKPNRFFGEN